MEREPDPPVSPLCIVGAGGFAKEARQLHLDRVRAGNAASRSIIFAEERSVWKARDVAGIPVLPLDEAIASAGEIVVAIADPAVRRRVTETIDGMVPWVTLVHPTALIGEGVSIGEGSIVCAGCILTTDIRIGRHAHLNLATTIGHDTDAGHFFTTAPGVRIGGRCTIADDVFIGTGGLIRDGILVAPGAVIGMGAVVVSNVTSGGRWMGVPARYVPAG